MSIFLSDKAVGLQLCNHCVRKFLCACGAAHILRQCFPFGNDIGYGFFDCRCRLCLPRCVPASGEAERMQAVGLILCCPAISGAEPWIGSKIAPSLPIFALGVRPRPPTRPATQVGNDITVKVRANQYIIFFGGASPDAYTWHRQCCL